MESEKCNINGIGTVQLADGRIVQLERASRPDLHYVLRLCYQNGEEETVPGAFRAPEDVHYGFDYFVDIDEYDLIESILGQLDLPVEEVLKIVFEIAGYNCVYANKKIVRAEIVDKRTGEVVASATNKYA